MGSDTIEERATRPRLTPRVRMVTLGCAKNEADSLAMGRLLEEAGYAVVGEEDAFDAVVVNTCSFIRAAVEEGIDVVLDLVDEAAGAEGEAPVIVAGCMPSRYGGELEDALGEVAAFVPCDEEGSIADVVAACLGGEGAPSKDDADGEGGESASIGGVASASFAGASWEDAPGRSFAYVKISDGCDRWCSYCTIPLIRGRYRSFPLAAIVDQVEREVAEGAREIVLIGQDTGLWGRDLPEPSSLAALLDALAPRFPHTWFRILYTQPENVTDELLSALARHPNVCPYLDIPLQHVDPSLLAAMNRTGSREEFSRLVARAREAVPGIALRTTLMAGFPGETEEMFEELVSFVEDEEFDYVGVFAYSREEGTRAHDMDGQIDEDEKAFRAERLRTVADAVSSAVVGRRQGTVLPVLVEGEEEDGQLFGRAMIQAPEVDGVTYVDGGQAGCFVDALVEDTLLYDMEAVVS